MSLLIKGPFFEFSKTLEIPEQDILSCFLILSLLHVHTPSQPPCGFGQRSPSDPNLSGSVPLAVVPSLTLPTAPPSCHRLTVKVKSNPLLVDLDLILSSTTDLTVGVPLAGTPLASRANIPGLSSLLCRSNRLPAALHQQIRDCRFLSSTSSKLQENDMGSEKL